MNKIVIPILLFLLTIHPSSAGQSGGNSKYVDLFIGTSGDHGQVDPAACVPYGMIRISPDMHIPSHSGYDYAQEQISGFSINRLSGIGCKGNGGNLSVKPSPKDVVLSLDRSTEVAVPGYYGVTLNNGVHTGFTATKNVAVESFRYPAGIDPVLTVNIASSFTRVKNSSYDIISTDEITGFVENGTTCNRGTYKLYFSLKSNTPFKNAVKAKKIVELLFDKTKDNTIEIRIGVSALDIETARAERMSYDNKDFASIRSEAAKQWNNLLSMINVTGGDDEARTLFYTSLYRIFLSPFDTASPDARFRAADGSIQRADGFRYYSSWSLWDSYRTKFPMIALLNPKEMRDMSLSLGQLYLYGKEDWATQFESAPTVRTEHSTVTILDSYIKGIITGRDLEQFYTGMKKHTETLALDRPDLRLEAVMDLWAMSRIARAVGKNKDAEAYQVSADSLFTATWEADFRKIDDRFTQMIKGGDLYQGTRWQYRWALPQYIDKMATSVGGMEKLHGELEYFFDNHLNNQGNEPGLHALLLFNLLGQPAQSQKLITTMLTKPTKHIYGGNEAYPEPVIRKIFTANPEGFLPEMDEDDGTMSAWYCFAAMGIFPLIVGEDNYEIVSPLFDRIEINLQNGNKFTIETQGRKSQEDIIKSIRFNNKPVTDYRISHKDITKGGILKLQY